MDKEQLIKLLEQKKARAYDLLSAREQINLELNQVNQNINQLSQSIQNLELDKVEDKENSEKVTPKK
jgi:chromosome segregation ATPase